MMQRFFFLLLMFLFLASCQSDKPQTWQYTFEEEATIIVFGKSKNDVLFLKKEVKIEKSNKWYLDFKAISKEEIQKELSKL